MNRKTRTQNDMILDHLRRHGSITPLQAIALYGVFRLAAVVHRLRGEGFAINTKDRRDPNGHPYAEYFYEPVAESNTAGRKQEVA